jgi:hypothetical protein
VASSLSETRTIAALFVGGTMHGRTEHLMTWGYQPANVMVPQFGPPDDGSVLHERALIARETYERAPDLDEGYGARAVYGYRWASYAPVHPAPQKKARGQR